MVPNCLRVMLTTGAGKILLSFPSAPVSGASRPSATQLAAGPAQKKSNVRDVPRPSLPVPHRSHFVQQGLHQTREDELRRFNFGVDFDESRGDRDVSQGTLNFGVTGVGQDKYG